MQIMSGPFQTRWRTKQKKDPTTDEDVVLGSGSKVAKVGQQSGIPFQRRSTIPDVMHTTLSEGGMPEVDSSNVMDELRDISLAGPTPRESYKDTMRKRARHWDNALPSMEQAAITYAPHIVQQWKDARDAEVNRINAMIEIYKEKPIHNCVQKGGDDGMEMDEAAIHS